MRSLPRCGGRVAQVSHLRPGVLSSWASLDVAVNTLRTPAKSCNQMSHAS